MLNSHINVNFTFFYIKKLVQVIENSLNIQ
jgi:hypothetical protein